MAERISISRLRHLVEILNRETLNMMDYSIEYNEGGVRLVRNRESIDVSPRLGKSALYEWIHAYRQGIEVGKELSSHE